MKLIFILLLLGVIVFLIFNYLKSRIKKKSVLKNAVFQQNHLKPRIQLKKLFIVPEENKELELKLQDPNLEELINKFNVTDKNDQKQIIQVSFGQQSEDLADLSYHVFMNAANIDHLLRLQIGGYAVWKLTKLEQIENIYRTIMDIAINNDLPSNVRANAVDIIMRSNNSRYTTIGQDLLNQLRRDENKIEDAVNNFQIRHEIDDLKEAIRQPNLLQEEIDQILHAIEEHERQLMVTVRPDDVSKRTVYSDTQNVHNHEINESVVRGAEKFVNSDRDVKDVSIHNLLEDIRRFKKHDEASIQISLNRIQTDTSTYYGGITLKAVFNRLIKHIYMSKHKDELLMRLGDELQEAKELCSTGHLSRLMNVLTGFDDSPKDISMKMNVQDEIYANIHAYLNKALTKATEEVMNSMISDDKTVYNIFVIEQMKDKVKELEKGYMEIITKEELKKEIEKAMKKYLQDEASLRIVIPELIKG